MEKEPLVAANKSHKAYFRLNNNDKVYFSGDFDSGNLEKAEQLSQLTYRVTPGEDKTRNTTHRTFFHFKVHGFKACTVKFIVTRAYLLEPLIKKDSLSDLYKPVVRKFPHLPFERISKDAHLYYSSMDEPELSFQFSFEQENWVEFAFSYPYSYQENQKLITSLNQQLCNHPDIYFHLQSLIKTSQTRKVHLVTITDKRNIRKERVDPVEGIFQEGDRPFKIDKPRVIISARVHPGQTPASHCMEGVLRFLVDQTDYRSYLLRKYFQFALIPIVNPEGVFEGMFRNDLNGDNLNRLYLHCDRRKHKSIWGIQQWVDSLDRADFFFDLHAHPSRKGFFIYGNAFEEFVEQVEAQIFSKMLEYNCPYFQNLDCIYSQKAMNAKDRFDIHSKEGCGRVFYHNKFKMIHSYTVECGYFAPTKLNRYPPQREFLTSNDYQCTEEWEKISSKQYSPESYMFMGKALLISVLDLFHVNPYSRISTSDFKSINSLRKFTAQRVYNQVERFRLVDSHCYRKIRDIASCIEQHYYTPRFKAFGLNINQNYGMRHRKKTFSLNAKIYRQNYTKDKSMPSQKSVKITELEHLEVEQSLICHKAQSQALGVSPSLPKLKANSMHRPTQSSSTAHLSQGKINLCISNNLTQDKGFVLHARSPSDRKQQSSLMRQVEKDVLKQIVGKKRRGRTKDEDGEMNLRVDRLQTFLRNKKESKGLLPSIHPQVHQTE